MLVRLADLTVEIINRYSFIETYCNAYRTETGKPDFCVTVTEAEIRSEEGGASFPEYAETLAVYRKIAEEILQFDGFLMHGAVFETEGVGTAFLAKSGVGKSTHLNLWQDLLGNKLTVINGDKPLIRFRDGTPYAYGTPWAGKERLETNKCVPLRNICFLSRGEENKAFPIGKEDVFLSLLPQIYMPSDSKKMEILLDLLSRLVESCNFYAIHCNLNPDAAKVAYRALFG